MERLGVVVLFLGIIGAGCGAAWLAGLSTRRWAPAVAFWVTLLGLTAISNACGVVFGDG